MQRRSQSMQDRADDITAEVNFQSGDGSSKRGNPIAGFTSSSFRATASFLARERVTVGVAIKGFICLFTITCLSPITSQTPEDAGSSVEAHGKVVMICLKLSIEIQVAPETRMAFSSSNAGNLPDIFDPLLAEVGYRLHTLARYSQSLRLCNSPIQPSQVAPGHIKRRVLLDGEIGRHFSSRSNAQPGLSVASNSRP